MTHRANLTLNLLIGTILAASCSSTQITPPPQADMPNPASVYCEQNGGKLELRQDASGGVFGICVFPDGSECDEWAYFRGECVAGGQIDPTPAANEIPTVLPVDQADYQGWWTYTHPAYHFTLQLPEDWIVEEVTGDPFLFGHQLILHSRTDLDREDIRVTFRGMGEETLLWPTGVGEGEFLQEGNLDIAGTPVKRMLLVCPTGEISSIWYHQDDSTPQITRGDLEFGVIFRASANHCEPGASLGGKTKLVGERIIASLTVPEK